MNDRSVAIENGEWVFFLANCINIISIVINMFQRERRKLLRDPTLSSFTYFAESIVFFIVFYTKNINKSWDPLTKIDRILANVEF